MNDENRNRPGHHLLRSLLLLLSNIHGLAGLSVAETIRKVEDNVLEMFWDMLPRERCALLIKPEKLPGRVPPLLPP